MLIVSELRKLDAIATPTTPTLTTELNLNKFKKSNTEGKFMGPKDIKTLSINIKVMEDSDDDDDELVSLRNFF